MSTQVICYANMVNVIAYSLWKRLNTNKRILDRCLARRQRAKRVRDFEILRIKYNHDVTQLRRKYGANFDAILHDIAELDEVCKS